MTLNLKQLATREFTEFTDWQKRPMTIFESPKVEVWIKNEGGFATLTMMKKGKLSGRKYSEKLTVGYHNPKVGGWVVSEHLEKNYPMWVTTTKRLCGMAK